MGDDDRMTDSGQRELDVALRLLSEGVPLSLLLDLATPPHSDEIYRDEAGDAAWLVGASS
ncbi:MAG TPA: hypothetical protein VHC43_17895 [Mycobacteriales bacterium]|nr:hypothetical protein [Mycobacteriales bacterium]